MLRLRQLLIAMSLGVAFALVGMAAASAAGLRPSLHAGSAPPSSSATRGIRPTGVISPTGFVPISPCRILDTRSATDGPLTTTATRVVQVSGTTGFTAQGGKSTGCGIPPEASALAASITSTNATGSGFLRAWAHIDTPPTATVMSYTAVGTAGITTGATLPLNSKIDVKAFNHGTDLVIDVTGYYVEPITAQVSNLGDLIGWSKTVVYASRLGVGTYQILASREVSGCTMTATPNDVKAKAVGYAIQKNIYVIITNSATGASMNADFTVSVTC